MLRQAGGLGGGSSAAALAKQREQEAEADQARKRFGNAKSISSAQFNSNEDSNAVDYEKQVSHVCASVLGSGVVGNIPAPIMQNKSIQNYDECDGRRSSSTL